MPTHSRFDDILWDQFHAQPPRPIQPNLHAPRNYVEMAARIDFVVDADDIWQSSRASAWTSFLHAFYAYKSPMFFAAPPPDTLSIEEQALWAGVAEALCTKLDLPVPEWTKEPRYFLAEPWDQAYTNQYSTARYRRGWRRQMTPSRSAMWWQEREIS